MAHRRCRRRRLSSEVQARSQDGGTRADDDEAGEEPASCFSAPVLSERLRIGLVTRHPTEDAANPPFATGYDDIEDDDDDDENAYQDRCLNIATVRNDDGHRPVTLTPNNIR